MKPGAGQPGIVGPWRRLRCARSAWALPHPASRSHMLRHAILCLRSERTKSGKQLRRDSVPTALKSSVALTRNRRRWTCELSSSSTPSQARWGVHLIAAGAPRGKEGILSRQSTQMIGGNPERPGRAQKPTCARVNAEDVVVELLMRGRARNSVPPGSSAQKHATASPKPLRNSMQLHHQN